MKRMILVLAAVAIAGYSFGQKKPKINQAEKAREEGNLGEAKEIIDAAIEHEKTKDDGKTWYYRGLIYASLDTTSNPQYQNLANEPLKVAMEAFAKSDELGGKSEYYISDANGLPILKSQQLQTLWGYYLNKGVEGYQAQETDKAVENFTKTQWVMPKDTTGYIYAGLAAQSGEDYATATKNYYSLINDLDYESEDIYNSLIYIEGTVNKDMEKALKLARDAKSKFPENPDFAKTEINYLIQMDKIDEARSGIESAIAKDPENSSLYFTLGVMYEELEQKDKAIEAYGKAVELDKTNFNANFNLAVLHYNNAVALVTEKNNLGITTEDRKKAKAMEKDILAALENAMPYWEGVLELEPENRTALESLQYIYSQLKLNEKAVKVSKKLEALGDAE